MRTIRITSRFFTDVIQGKAATVASNLPADVQLLDLRFDLCTNQVYAVIRSDSFEDIAELYPIPEFKITYVSTSKTVSQPAVGIKHIPKPAAVAKSELTPTKKVATQPIQTAGKIENEFSPEQRRLLSFRVEQDHVIAKPTQFLKAEWEDINEVVKSIGGRWVKGDIISYWEIPLD